MHSNYHAPAEQSSFLLEKVFAESLRAANGIDLARAVLSEGGKFVTGVLAPLNQVGDQQSSVLLDGKVKTPDGFPDAFNAYAQGGWAGLDLPETYGGQELPLPLQVAFAEMINACNISFGMLAIQTRAAAWLALEHADKDLRDRVVPKLTAGEWTATICITEPQAGSDVARVSSSAIPQADGSYRLSGTKMFISFADHDMTEQIVHFVLARTPDAPPGTRGLSLFAVPKLRFEDGQPNSLSVSRVEKKMGLKASPTCVLDFDQAEAVRIGDLHYGLPCMFAMVKLMRLEVAIQGVGLADAANQTAWEYAETRKQGGHPERPPVAISEHIDVRRMLLDSSCRTSAMRALVLETAVQLHLERTSEDQDVARRAAGLANFLLPVCKACASELASFASNNALQVHGGHGYIVDTGVEQYVRDSRVLSIYEGTNGIQAIDLLSRKLFKDKGDGYQVLSLRMHADIGAARGRVDEGIRKAIRSAVDLLDQQTRNLLRKKPEHPQQMLTVAVDFLRLVGLVAGAWMWLRMLTVDDGIDSRRAQEAEFYVRYVLPEVTTLAQRIEQYAELFDTLKQQ